MHGVSIRYEFGGDETVSETAVASFISAVDGDEEVAGTFHYRINEAREGNTRAHRRHRDTPETFRTLPPRGHFRTFVAQLKEMANGTLSAVQFTERLATAT